MFLLTGCLSTCDKFDYTIQQFTNLQAFEQKLQLRDRFKMKFVIPTGRHEQKEQVRMKGKSKMCNNIPLKVLIFSISSMIPTAS